MTDIIESLRKGDVSYSLRSGPVFKGPTKLHLDAIGEITRLRKALDAAAEDFALIEERIDCGQVRRAGETAHQGQKEARRALEVNL